MITLKKTGSSRMVNVSSPEDTGKTSVVIIQPTKGLFCLDLDAVWPYRELLYFLIWRDIKVRYKQTVIGAGWAICQPLMTMVIFTIVFGRSEERRVGKEGR